MSISERQKVLISYLRHHSLPKEIEINHPLSICYIKYKPKWKFEGVDWQSWRMGLPRIKFENQSSINKSNQQITELLLNSTCIIQKSSGS